MTIRLRIGAKIIGDKGECIDVPLHVHNLHLKQENTQGAVVMSLGEEHSFSVDLDDLISVVQLAHFVRKNPEILR